MAGLGKVGEKGTFLTIAGGYVWNRKADQDDPDYATQDYTKADGEEGTRSGARYADLTGKIVKVEFRTHDKYGENINAKFEVEDEDGEKTYYIVSISTNNRYSQDLMKMLLVGDINKEVFMKPYDFVGKDQRRAMGISFRQDGEKLNLKVEGAPQQEADWFKNASKKQIKRFFEDLTDWYVAEIEEKICPLFKDDSEESAEPAETKTKSSAKKKEKKAESKTEPAAKEEEEAPKRVTPLKMKKFLKEYISENYEGKELPTLSKDELKQWYELALQTEELPFKAETNDAKVDSGTVDEQLSNLLDS